jgi:hypothetical protein
MHARSLCSEFHCFQAGPATRLNFGAGGGGSFLAVDAMASP